jgi:hypothetical protein
MRGLEGGKREIGVAVKNNNNNKYGSWYRVDI